MKARVNIIRNVDNALIVEFNNGALESLLGGSYNYAKRLIQDALDKSRLWVDGPLTHTIDVEVDPSGRVWHDGYGLCSAPQSWFTEQKRAIHEEAINAAIAAAREAGLSVLLRPFNAEKPVEVS